MKPFSFLLLITLIASHLDDSKANFILACGGNVGTSDCEIITGTGACTKIIAGVPGLDCNNLFQITTGTGTAAVTSVYMMGLNTNNGDERIQIYKWTPLSTSAPAGSWGTPIYDLATYQIPNSCYVSLCNTPMAMVTIDTTSTLYIVAEKGSTSNDCSKGTYGAGGAVSGTTAPFTIAVLNPPTECTVKPGTTGCMVPTTDGFYYVCPGNGNMYKYTAGTANAWTQTPWIPSVTNTGEDLNKKCTSIGATNPDVFVPRNTNVDNASVLGATWKVSGANVAARTKVADVNMATGTTTPLRGSSVLTCGSMAIVGGALPNALDDYLVNFAATSTTLFTGTQNPENLVSNRKSPGVTCLASITNFGIPTTCTARA